MSFSAFSGLFCYLNCNCSCSTRWYLYLQCL